MFATSLSSIGKHRSASSRVHDNMLLAQMKDIRFLFFFQEWRIPRDSLRRRGLARKNELRILKVIFVRGVSMPKETSKR